jgi:ferrous iron transport protein A
MYNLSQVPLNTPCIVQEVSEESPGLRLMEMGLVPGTEVQRILDAPSGDPIAILVDNSFILGLRKGEAEVVTVYFPE